MTSTELTVGYSTGFSTRVPPLADRQTVDRLAGEFPAVPRPVLTRVVGACRADLSGIPSGALPELLERLARQRLLDGDRAARRPS